MILGPGRLYPRIRILGAGSLEDSNRRPMARDWDIRSLEGIWTRPEPWAGEIHNSLVGPEKQKLYFPESCGIILCVHDDCYYRKIFL